MGMRARKRQADEQEAVDRGFLCARLRSYDQQEEGEHFEADVSSTRSCKTLWRLWSGDVGAQKKHEEVIMLCKFCWDCPA